MSWKQKLANLFNSASDNDRQFWQLIDESREAARPAGEINEFAVLTKLLKSRGRRTIRKFVVWHHQLHIKAYRWNLWRAVEFIDDGCSDDAFSDFRDWLIWQGQAVFDRVVANPECLADYLQSVGMLTVGHSGHLWVAICSAYARDGSAERGGIELFGIDLAFPDEPLGNPARMSPVEQARHYPKLAALKSIRQSMGYA